MLTQTTYLKLTLTKSAGSAKNAKEMPKGSASTGSPGLETEKII